MKNLKDIAGEKVTMVKVLEEELKKAGWLLKHTDKTAVRMLAQSLVKAVFDSRKV